MKPPASSANERHVHLEPVGGVAGDMFVAAMLDLFPELAEVCWQDLVSSGVLQHVSVNLQPSVSHGLIVKRLQVTVKDQPVARTGHYRDLRQLLDDSALDDAVKVHAQAILHTLARAEGAVHGVTIDDVHFHEVADWDSIVDVVAAASVIERAGVDSWSCAALPLGSGLVSTEHGMLPVPAPATAWLLKDLPVWDDGEPGERVTPTGAAIVSYVLGLSVGGAQPGVDSAEQRDGSQPGARSIGHLRRPAGVLAATGCGAGQRELQKRPNILRCLLIDMHPTNWPDGGTTPRLKSYTDQVIDDVMQLSFDIDDMTPEELAISMDHIRDEAGVLDVNFQLGMGKKGRPFFVVNVLCRPADEVAISVRCFEETTTLGLRVQCLQRRTLERQLHTSSLAQGELRIKTAARPGGQVSAKVESDDLMQTRGLQARRSKAEEVRKRFET